MKKIFFLLLLFSLSTQENVIAVTSIEAHQVIRNETNSYSGDENTALKNQTSFSKFTEKMKKSGIFSDPIKKWGWFALFGVLLAIILLIIASSAASNGLAVLGALSWIFGAVSFFIWILKLIIRAVKKS